MEPPFGGSNPPSPASAHGTLRWLAEPSPPSQQNSNVTPRKLRLDVGTRHSELEVKRGWSRLAIPYGMASKRPKSQKESGWRRVVAFAVGVGALAAGLAEFLQHYESIRDVFLPPHPHLTATTELCSRREIKVVVANTGRAPSTFVDGKLSITSSHETFTIDLSPESSGDIIVEPGKSAITIALQPVVGGVPLVLPRYPTPCKAGISLKFTDGTVGDLECDCPET